MNKPSLYQNNSGNKRLTWKYFFAWITLSVYHSIIVYFFGYMIWTGNSAILPSQYTDLCSFGTFLIHNVVFIVTLKIWLIARNHTIIFILTILLSVLAFIASTVIYNVLYVMNGQMNWVYNNLLASPIFWISNLLICVAALTPDYVIIALKIFNIKVRPTNHISNGLNRFRKDQKTIYPSIITSPNDINESTYM